MHTGWSRAQSTPTASSVRSPAPRRKTPEPTWPGSAGWPKPPAWTWCRRGRRALFGSTSTSRGPSKSPVRQGRVLGIDAGERRVGVALSDELWLLASPLCVLDRARGLAPVLDALTEVAQREGVAQMVVGLPLNADGSLGQQARRAKDFARVAARVVGVPVELWDERLSTQAAEAIVRAQGRNTRRVRQRGQLDAIAAAVILQDSLDRQCHPQEERRRIRNSSLQREADPSQAQDDTR